MALRNFLSLLLILSALDMRAVKGTTTAPTAAPSTSTVTTFNVFFRSVLQTFTTELLNPSSVEFQNRASLIQSQLQPKFQSEFPSSFESFRVISFRNGSIITLIRVGFNSTFLPNKTQIASVLINAAPTVTGFDIEESTVTVNGLISSGVNHKISLITAFCLVLLSWFLSNQR